ncbi:MAG: hypothetical protein IJM30_12640 [Thermoguttaceae bacterium]|nr:hypothetical protein [Thermoguttaceae bacterium]
MKGRTTRFLLATFAVAIIFAWSANSALAFRPGGFPPPGGGFHRRPIPPPPDPIKTLKGEDGQIALDSLADRLAELNWPGEIATELVEILALADADDDGFVSEEEQADIDSIREDRRLEKRLAVLLNDDGQYDLSLLRKAREFSFHTKRAIEKCDADSDGFLDLDELENAKDVLAGSPHRVRAPWARRRFDPFWFGPRPFGPPAPFHKPSCKPNDETGDGTGDETGDGTGDETGDGTGDETGDEENGDGIVAICDVEEVDFELDDPEAEAENADVDQENSAANSSAPKKTARPKHRGFRKPRRR